MLLHAAARFCTLLYAAAAGVYFVIAAAKSTRRRLRSRPSCYWNKYAFEDWNDLSFFEFQVEANFERKSKNNFPNLS